MNSNNCSCNNIKLSNNDNFEWHNQNRTNYDLCQINKKEYESTLPGYLQLTGFDCQHQNKNKYTKILNTLQTHQKQYYDTLHRVNVDTDLIHPPLTNLNSKHQLFTRPYVGCYKGPGNHSIDPNDIDIESFMYQGFSSMQKKPCEKTSGMDLTNYYLNLLPCYGNPQRVEHIVEPPVRIGGWIRGGEPTRDIVRKINYNKHIQNLKNNQLLHK